MDHVAWDWRTTAVSDLPQPAPLCASVRFLLISCFLVHKDGPAIELMTRKRHDAFYFRFVDSCKHFTHVNMYTVFAVIQFPAG